MAMVNVIIWATIVCELFTTLGLEVDIADWALYSTKVQSVYNSTPLNNYDRIKTNKT